MNSTENSDETVSARSTSSCSEDYHETQTGGGDGPQQVNVSIIPLKLEKNSSKNIRLPERRTLKKPKKLTLKTGLVTKIPKLNRENSTENLNEKQNVLNSKKLNSPRYYTAIRKSFTKRKSFSQMNLREAKHLKQDANPSSMNSPSKTPCYNLTSCIVEGEQKYEQAIEMNDSFYQIMRLNGNTDEEQMAGMKIFATVILNAWRKRRDEVKQLHDEIARIKKSSIKVKNQIHVLNSMFKIEQKQNEELNLRLRRMMEDQRKVQTSFDQLNESHKELTSKSVKLQATIDNKEQKIEGLEALLDETRAELFKCMANERELECELSIEQRKVQELENSKNELYNQLNELKTELLRKNLEIDEINRENNEQISQLYEQFCAIEQRMEHIKKKDKHYNKLIEIESNQRIQIENLKDQVYTLNTQIDSTLINRIKKYTLGDCSIPYGAFKCLHLMIFYLLPAVSPPLKDDLPDFSVLQRIIRSKVF